MAWPVGTIPFAVDELVAAGRDLEQAAVEGKPVDKQRAIEVAMTLTAYLDSLPVDQQAAVSKRLVAALSADKLTFRATVAPKKLPRGQMVVRDVSTHIPTVGPLASPERRVMTKDESRAVQTEIVAPSAVIFDEGGS